MDWMMLVFSQSDFLKSIPFWTIGTAAFFGWDPLTRFAGRYVSPALRRPATEEVQQCRRMEKWLTVLAFWLLGFGLVASSFMSAFS